MPKKFFALPSYCTSEVLKESSFDGLKCTTGTKFGDLNLVKNRLIHESSSPPNQAQTHPLVADTMGEDTRNLDWKSNNVGSKLLSKMGWKDGQGVGKRYRDEQIATEGMRVKRRQVGLGLGATHAVALAASASGNHADEFANALAEFRKVHGSGDDSSETSKDRKQKKKKKKKDKKRKKEKKAPVLPTNKVTHGGIRSAKFKPKTSQDLKAIFAGGVVFGDDEQD